MPEYEHAQMSLPLKPTEIIAQCNLRDVSVNNKVHLEVQKCMPRLKQSGIIVRDRLSKHLQ